MAMFSLWLDQYSSFLSHSKTWKLAFTGDSEFPLGVFADELVNKSIPDHMSEKVSRTEHERMFSNKKYFPH